MAINNNKIFSHKISVMKIEYIIPAQRNDMENNFEPMVIPLPSL